MANVDMLTKASFGQYGSTYLTGTGDCDFSGSSATRYVIAITSLESTTAFSALENVDGNQGSISTVTAENDHDGDGGFGRGENGTDMGSNVIPIGVTIYGKWDRVTLSAGSCICYFAPKGY